MEKLQGDAVTLVAEFITTARIVKISNEEKTIYVKIRDNNDLAREKPIIEH